MRLFVLCTLLSLVPSVNAQASRPYTQTESYVVYFLVIPRLTRGVTARLPRQFVISDTTFPSKTSNWCFPDKYQEEFSEAFRDYDQVNEQSWRLLRSFRLSHAYEFVSDKQLGSMWKSMPPWTHMQPKTLEEVPPPTWNELVQLSKAQPQPQVEPTNDKYFLWHDFYERFQKSGGYFVLSAVGFNSAKNKAVVRVNLFYGGLGRGGRRTYLLKKRRGHWKILSVQSTCGSVSDGSL